MLLESEEPWQSACFLSFVHVFSLYFPNRNSCVVNFPWYFPYGFKILFLFRHLCSWRGFFVVIYDINNDIVNDHLQRSINNVINIPRTIIHPTQPHPPPHPALSRSMIQRDHLQRSINNVINIPRTIIHPTRPHPPPHPALLRSMIQRDHLQRSKKRCAVIGEPGSPRVYIHIHTLYIIAYTINKYVQFNVYIYKHTYVQTNAYIYTYTYTYTYTYVQTNAYIYTYTYVHVQINMYIYIYIL